MTIISKFITFCFIVLCINVNAQVVVKQFKPDSKAGKDICVGSLPPNDIDLGDYPILWNYAWTHGGALNVERFFLDFDFGCIPPNSIIKKADLHLFYYPDFESSVTSKHSGNTSMKVYRVIEDWEEDSLSWVSQPNIDSSVVVEIPSLESDTSNLVVDLKELMDAYIKDPLSFGFRFSLEDESPYSCVLFASSDAEDAALHPEFHLEYEIPDSGCTELFLNSPCGADTYSDSSIPEMNFGNEEAVVVSGGPIRRTHLDFNLNWIPEGTYLNKLDLLLKEAYFDGHPPLSSIQLIPVYEGWSVYSVSWSNQPELDMENSIEISPNPEWTTFDLMPISNQIMDYQYGVVLRLTDETQTHSYSFHSSESPTVTYRPKLNVCYGQPNSVHQIDIGANNLLAFPLPVKSVFTVQMEDNSMMEQLKLFQANGELLIEKSLNHNSFDLDLGNYPVGVYYLLVKQGGTEHRKRILKD